jgi:hypothetical protein
LLQSNSQAHADVIRTGPNGNSVETTREVENGALIQTTTGPNGQSAVTTTTAEDGTIYRTTVGPNDREASSTHNISLEEGQITRESTGPRGHTRTIIRSR